VSPLSGRQSHRSVEADLVMSGLLPKADVNEHRPHVPFVSEAEVAVIRSVELIVQPGAHDVVGELNVRGRPSGRTQRCRDVECPQVEIEIF
jgi:hypothetical protein